MIDSEQDLQNLKNLNNVVDEGGNVPLTLQTQNDHQDQNHHLIQDEASQSYMSPQSQDLSQFTQSAFNTEGRRADESLIMLGHEHSSSLEASQIQTKRDNKRLVLDNQHQKQQSQKRHPGAPLLEGQASQKQFIIKKQKSQKRGSSKGAGLMKAYLPNLIAKKDVTYVTPTNAQQAHNAANFASASQNQKFITQKRHTSSNSANFASQQHQNLKQIDPYVLAHGEIIVLNDIQPGQQQSQSNSIPISTTELSQNYTVVDDYQRQSVVGLSQDGAAQNMQMRRQKSQVRGDSGPNGAGLNHPNSGNQQQQSSNIMQKRVRRNSLADGHASNQHSKETRNNMLPPIFSGPQKKTSQKAAKLIPHPPHKPQHLRSQISEASPLRYKSEQFVSQPAQSDRADIHGQDQRSSILENTGPQSVPQNSRKINQQINHQDQEELLAGEDMTLTEEQIGQNIQAPKGAKVNFVKKNEEKLRQMQEQRAAEIENIEKERTKLLRRQEKLKQNVLRDAQAYKQRKAERQSLLDQSQIQINNQRNSAAAKGDCMSPPRLSGQAKPKSNLASPSGAAMNKDDSHIDDDKTAEDRAEEKKKMDVMRKFYRNRHSSFLQALVAQKAQKVQDEQAVKEAAEKKKQKITQKVLGDGSRIRSKVFEPTAALKDGTDHEEQVPASIALLQNLNATAKSTNVRSSSKQPRTIKRGNSLSSLSHAEKAYNDTSTNVSSGQKRQQNSRGSTRAASSKGGNSERKAASVANRSAQNFTRGRTLTPKVHGGKKAAHETNTLHEMTDEQKMEFDEKREEEILKQAAEKKARAQAIRDRQEKQLQAIKDKVNKANAQQVAEEDRKKKLQEQARERVQQRAEEIKNMPSLREQQDSRLKHKRSDDDNKLNIASPTPAKPRAPVDPEGFNKFLERNMTMAKPVQLNITDMKEWKKRQRVEPETKVFVIKGGYGDIKRALKSRGWVENKDRESPCFDFLWTLMTKDVRQNELLSHQIVNHFATATSITTKVGLTHSLKNLIWFNAVDIDTFYPRCYDLAIGEELEDFIQEFKQIKAVSYLKKYVREMREAFEEQGEGAELASKSCTQQIFKVALKVCQQRTRDLDDLIDDPDGFESLVTDVEWKILSTDEFSEETLAAQKHKKWMDKQADIANGSKHGPKKSKKEKKEAKVAAREETKASREKKKQAVAAVASEDDEDAKEDDEYDAEYDDEYGDYGDEDDVDEVINTPGAAANSNGAGKASQQSSKPQVESQNKNDMPFAVSKMTPKQLKADKSIGEKYPKFAEAVKVLDILREKYPQFNLDGERNIWIMKPAGSSRGRGICLKRDLCEILDMIKHKDIGQTVSNQTAGQLYICQKYIENTMIMKCRKFDIRQWVLVTDWNPLTIWIYAEPYIRFPAADFDFNKISNRYSHLSNNSIAKHGKKVTTTHTIDGNMWDLEEFQKSLLETYGTDIWEEKIVESIKNIVINSLESVQDNFESKKGVPFEMFGYDIMVDDDFNCWLIEVNSSPAMDYSTDVTERLVKMVLEDTIKVVIDYGTASAKKQKKVDTGGFECVYKAKRIVDKPMNSFGLNMEVVGKKITKGHLKKY